MKFFCPEKYPPFLHSEIDITSPEESFFHIIPVPLEKSVSYGKGASAGPSAILRASQQLELFDGISIPAKDGIYTLPPVRCRAKTEKILKALETAVTRSLAMNSLPVVLGGEHTVTLGAVRAARKLMGAIGIIQFDAHADLRDTYENNPLSHACVMRRIWELQCPIVQIGVRSLSKDESLFRQENSIIHFDASSLSRKDAPETIIPETFPEHIYITFDIDALSPAVIPATGTPEPGGLEWYQTMDLLEKIISSRRVIGFDVVELAPIPGLHAPDFAAARLVYNMMGMIVRSKNK